MCVYIPWCKRGGQRTTFGCQFSPSAALRQALSGGSCRCASHFRLAGSQASRQFSCLGLSPQGVLGLQICAITSSNMRCQDYLASFFLLSHLIWTVSFSDWIFNVILFVVIRRYPQLLKKSRHVLRSLATSQPTQDPVNTSKHQNPVTNMATCFSGFLSVLAYIWGINAVSTQKLRGQAFLSKQADQAYPHVRDKGSTVEDSNGCQLIKLWENQGTMKNEFSEIFY